MKFSLGCEGCRVTVQVDDRAKMFRVAAILVSAIAAGVTFWFHWPI